MELLFYMELAHWVQLRIGKDYEAKCFWKKMAPRNTWHFFVPIAEKILLKNGSK